MDLAGGIGDNAGREGQEIADVDVGGVGNVDDFRNVHCLLIGDLLRVDGGGGGADVDLLLYELYAGEDDADGGSLRVEVIGGAEVEAGFFDADCVGLGLARSEGAAAVVVGGDMEGGFGGLLDGDLRGGDYDAVLVDHGEGYGFGIGNKVLGRARGLGGGGCPGGEKCGECEDSTLLAWHAIQIEASFVHFVGRGIRENHYRL